MSKSNPVVNNNIIDIDLAEVQKKSFRFYHRDDCIVEINISDMGIVGRVSEAYPKLLKLNEKAAKMMTGITVDENDPSDALATMGANLTAIDTEMRGLIDYIFNADVSAKAAPDGSMYDPFNGSFRFEYVLQALLNQYEANLGEEFGKMQKQMQKHTAKYIK